MDDKGRIEIGRIEYESLLNDRSQLWNCMEIVKKKPVFLQEMLELVLRIETNKEETEEVE